MVFNIKSPLQLDWHFDPQTRTLALDSSSKEETPLKWLKEATLTPVQNPRWLPSLRRAKSAFWPAWPRSRIIGAAAFKWAWRRTAAAAARSRTCTPSPAGWTRAAAARCARSSRRKARCSFCTVSAGEKAGLIRSQWNRPKNVNVTLPRMWEQRHARICCWHYESLRARIYQSPVVNSSAPRPRGCGFYSPARSEQRQR